MLKLNIGKKIDVAKSGAETGYSAAKSGAGVGYSAAKSGAGVGYSAAKSGAGVGYSAAKSGASTIINNNKSNTNFHDYTMNNNTEQFLSVLIILAPLVFLFLVLTITCLVNTYGFHNLFYVIFLIIVIEKMGLIKTNVGSTIGIS